ncbi:hypothetical protein LTR56_015089 [Elasticomyces elasticus]|nr:hypothetical protein LTR56_015089 [Elasticomyces elasticus]KAK3639311.1 hypothetical protein LTR22_017512 [Elasticomyces elasticus]
MEKQEVVHTEASGDGSPQPSDTLKIEDGIDLNDKKRARKLVRKMDLHILPLCAWIYLLNYLDRGNIGNSKVLNSESGDDLLQQTNMTATNYAVAVSLFSVAYAVFEVPSNWIMKRYVRPSRWLAILLGCWGLFTIGFCGVRTYAQVVVLRFLIGMFEAGFFPGIVYFITMWYPVEERSVRIAFVLASATAAGAFGGCIAYGVGHINGVAGLEGFRWLFIIEGLVTVACVLLVLFLLPDYPSTARFLTEDDKKFVEARIRVKGGGYTNERSTKKEVLETIFSPRMMAHYLAYTCDCVPLGSLTFFSPTIVAGLGYTSVQAQLMASPEDISLCEKLMANTLGFGQTVPPWIVGYCFCLFLGWSADRYNARGWHIMASSIIGGIGWLTAGLLPQDAYIQSAWVTCNVPSIVTMGIATALNNSAAGVSQVTAQWIWKPKEAHLGYPTGNFTCAAFSFATAIIAVGLRLHYGKLNAIGAKDARGQARVWLL